MPELTWAEKRAAEAEKRANYERSRAENDARSKRDHDAHRAMQLADMQAWVCPFGDRWIGGSGAIYFAQHMASDHAEAWAKLVALVDGMIEAMPRG